MGHLFIDIETYVSETHPESGLNPYYPESKVIVISYNYYNSFDPPAKHQIKPPIFLKEWESNERKILTRFYEILKGIKADDKYMRFYGFNILAFDLPYLYGRMNTLGIGDKLELYDILFRSYVMDMYQLSPMISEETKKFKQLWGINQKKVSKFFELKVKEGTGVECSRFYDEGQYDKIIKYCTEEFNFEQMLEAFYLHILKTLV